MSTEKRSTAVGWAIGLSVVVMVAALADLWVSVRQERAMVSSAVMSKAAARIAERKAPGDLVVHSPLLTVRELSALGPLAARPDRPKAILRGRRRMLVLDFADRPMFGLGDFTEEVPLGEGLVLRTYPPTGDSAGALWTLGTKLTPTTMVVERGARKSPCSEPRSGGGYQCPGEPEWLYAAVRVLRVGGQDRECVWAHPTTNGAIVFNVPAQPEPAPGAKLVLKVQAGLVDDAVRNTPDGAAVTADIVHSGRSQGRLTVQNRVGWFERKVTLAPGRSTQLRITTPRDGRRHFCVSASVSEEAA